MGPDGSAEDRTPSTSARWVSSRTSAKRRERLQELDLSAAEINRHARAHRLAHRQQDAAEIAVAIVAEITAVRQRRDAEARAALEALAVAS